MDLFAHPAAGMAKDSTILVRLDVHKESIVAAYSVGFGEGSSIGNVGVLERDIDRPCKRNLPPSSGHFESRASGPDGV